MPGLSTQRRAKLTIMLATLDVLDFTAEMAEIYGHIIQQIGYSRRKIIDRMIAATARAGDLTLITANGADFAEIPELKLEVWPVD